MNKSQSLTARVSAGMNDFASFTVDVIYGRRRGKRAKVWGAFLFMLSLVFSFITLIRRQLYRAGILRAQHLGCLVVVVGNLTVGGTGKTPVVESPAWKGQEGRHPESRVQKQEGTIDKEMDTLADPPAACPATGGQ